jgi:hypothetical protein
VNPAILFRRRLEGTRVWVWIRGDRLVGYQETYDFIDDTFVGVEIEGEPGVAARDVSTQGGGGDGGPTIFR